MSGLPNLANRDYVQRINRAVDYITQNLAGPLQLEDVARAACFSPYHFHRIFRGVMGETLASFVKRVRLERAAYLLSHRKGASLTEIALGCGFSSSSDFSRSFRAEYGVAPSQFDSEELRRSGRAAMRGTLPPDGRYRLEGLPVAENPDAFKVDVRRLPARRIAYIRVHRPYEGTHVVEATQRLMAWAVGLEVPDTIVEDDHVSVTTFAPCVAAEIGIKGTVDVELRALEWFFLHWLPASGYVPAHQPLFEAFNGRPFAHGMEYFELRAQLPIVHDSVRL